MDNPFLLVQIFPSSFNQCSSVWCLINTIMLSVGVSGPHGGEESDVSEGSSV